MRAIAPLALALALGLTATACSGGGSGGSDGPRTTFGGSRPVELRRPQAYDDAQSWPLLLVLHGYGVNASIQVSYMGLDALVDSAGLLMLAPEGTENDFGDQFWNGTDACCGFGEDVDDVAYLRSLVEEVSEDYTVDPARVFVIGHSNGGFMAHRLACDASDVFTAILSLAGATWANASLCTPTDPVSVLQIHGTADDSILYDGEDGSGGIAYPGAVETVTRWQVNDACTAGLVEDPVRKDFDLDVDGAETRVERFACAAPLGVELWTIEGGGHIPTFTDFPGDAWAWLSAHPRN